MRRDATMLRDMGRVFGAWALFTFAAAGTASAGTTTKTFEFGPGTTQERANVRTFPVRCHGSIDFEVKFKRDSEAGEGKSRAGAQNDVPIKIDLREPDLSEGQEGPIYRTVSATARVIEQTENIGPPRRISCSLPWRVRVRHADDGPPARRVSGTITVKWESTSEYTDGNLSLAWLRSGESAERDFYITGVGTYIIRGSWVGSPHMDNPVTKALGLTILVKLKFELIDPNGNVVASDEGYPFHPTSAYTEGDKLTTIYTVPDCNKLGNGKWKLRITNVDVRGITVQGISPKVTHACPN